MQDITIIGAGLAGLLAANIMRYHKPVIMEQQDKIPNNHSAVLRFRSNALQNALSIPFKKVTVIKDMMRREGQTAVDAALTYSYKCTGVYRSDRSLLDLPQSGDRWIAPPDLIQRMIDRIDKDRILLNVPFEAKPDKGSIISTIPMPALMKLLEYPVAYVPKFESKKGYNVHARIHDCDAYVSMYIADPQIDISRISITGNELIIEIPEEEGGAEDTYLEYVDEYVAQALYAFNIEQAKTSDVSIKAQQYQKILPIDEGLRKAFILWATEKHNIFSLGRYATWRPSLVLDDLVSDIHLIEHWITNLDRYSIAQRR